MSKTGEPQKGLDTSLVPPVTTPAADTSQPVHEQVSVLPEAVGDQLLVAVHDAYLQVGRTVIERSIARANIVLTSATAAATAYTALLGLVYSTAHGHPLPAIALWPVLYLGLDIALTAFYAGYLTPRATSFNTLPVGASQDVAEARLTIFLRWAVNATMSRAWALRMALVSLGLGLMLLPIGFISFHGAQAILVEGVPISVLFLCVGIEIARRHKAEQVFEYSAEGFPDPMPVSESGKPSAPVPRPVPVPRRVPVPAELKPLTELSTSLAALAPEESWTPTRWQVESDKLRMHLDALQAHLRGPSGDYPPGTVNMRQAFQPRDACAKIQKSSDKILTSLSCLGNVSLSHKERAYQFKAFVVNTEEFQEAFHEILASSREPS